MAECANSACGCFPKIKSILGKVIAISPTFSGTIQADDWVLNDTDHYYYYTLPKDKYILSKAYVDSVVIVNDNKSTNVVWSADIDEESGDIKFASSYPVNCKYVIRGQI